MSQLCTAKDTVLSRISAIVDILMQKEYLFRQRLEKNEIMQVFSNSLEKISPEELVSLDDGELTARIDRVMVREAVAGTLNDLTPEQMKIFDAAVEGR